MKVVTNGYTYVIALFYNIIFLFIIALIIYFSRPVRTTKFVTTRQYYAEFDSNFEFFAFHF